MTGPGLQLGRYELVARIARGGMAELYRAVQRGPSAFAKSVAVKVLLEELALDRDLVELFLFEARLAAQLAHPNICEVLDVGFEGGRYFIAMEFIHGRSLEQLLLRARGLGERLEPALAAHLIARVAEGLNHAHERRAADGSPLGIVHRDISPQNVMVSHDGHVKVVDFGIAHAAGRIPRTLVGQVRGKVAYMSPEQVEGRPLDARSDLFSLGIVLHEALSGQPLFRAESDFRTMQNVLTQPIPSLRGIVGICDGLADLVAQLLERSADERPPTARELTERLDALAQDLGPVGPARMASVMAVYFPNADASLPSSWPLPDATDRKHSAPARQPENAGTSKVGALHQPKQAPAPGTRVMKTPPSFPWRRWVPWTLGLAALLLALPLWLHGVRSFTRPSSPPPEKPLAAARPVQPPLPIRIVATAEPGQVDPRRAEREASAPHRRGHPPTVLSRPRPAPIKPAASPSLAATGRLTLDTSPWADIYLGERKLGTTPLVDVELPAGRVHLRAVNSGAGLNKRFDLEVPAGRPVTQRLVW